MTEAKDDFISIIVLAAGLSTRFGRNKLLEPLGDSTMIERVVSECLASKARQVIVVVGHEGNKVRRKLKNYKCEIVTNKNFARGQTTSTKEGLSRVMAQAKAVIILPGDVAMVDRNIINHVIQEYRSSNAPIVTAAFHVKRGHPILFDANLMKELKNIEEDTQGLRSVVSRHESKVRGVETSEAALVDIDRLSDLQLLDASSENLGQT